MVFILLLVLCVILGKIILANNNIFHPSKAYPYFQLVYVVPYIILYLIQGDLILDTYSFYNIRFDLDNLIVLFLVINILTIFAYYFGVRICLKDFDANYRNSSISSVYTLRLRKTAIIFFIISLSFFFFYYRSLGGIAFYLDNLGNRAVLSIGSGYLYSFVNFFIFITTGLFIIAYKQKLISGKLMLAVVGISLLLLLISGSRSVVVRYIIIMSIIAYFTFRPALKKVFSFKNRLLFSALLVVMVFYVAVVPIFRTATIDGSEMTFKESFSKATKELESVAKGNLYTEIQLNIISLFEKNDYWYGKSFLDLVYIPVPRSVMPNKPGTDDGVYIFNLVAGNKVTVGEAFIFSDDFYLNSWPPSTFGAGFANFGFVGPIILFFILGLIISFFYKKMLKSHYKFIFVFLYAYVFWRLHLSNLHIAEVVTVIVILFFLLLVFPQVKKFRV